MDVYVFKFKNKDIRTNIGHVNNLVLSLLTLNMYFPFDILSLNNL